MKTRTVIAMNVLLLCALLVLMGCPMVSANGPSGQNSGIEGRIFSKSDVATIPDRPLRRLVMAVPAANFDTLLDAANVEDAPSGDIMNLRSTIQGDIETYATGHDISDEEGQYTIEVEEGGTYFLCLSDRTTLPEGDPWSVVGCMRVDVPEGETAKQDIYTMFGKIVSP